MVRRGISPLVLALALLAVVGVALLVQNALTRQTAGEVHARELAELARLQAQSAIAELRAQVAEDANRPGTPLYTKLRELLDEPPAALDLAPLLRAPERRLSPLWGRAGSPADASARGDIRRWGATLGATRSARDVGGSEEWVGLLELSAAAGMSDAAGGARRTLRERYELRTVLAGPPRPFDQMGVYFGRLRVLTDAGAAEQVRRDLLRRHAELEARAAALPQAVRSALAAPLAALMPAAEAERRMPPLPEGEAAVWGFFASELALDRLDLARDAQRRLEAARAAETAVSAAGADPARLATAVGALIARHNEALNALWEYQRVLTIVPRDSPAFAESAGRFLPRLTAEHFLDRAHLAMPPGDPLLGDWLAGRGRLEGVLDLTAHASPVALAGELQGRAVVLVGAGGAALRDLNRRAARAGSRLTIVSLGGDLTLAGTVHASVIALAARPGGAHGRVSIPASALLVGNLLVPDPQPARLALEGRLRYDPELFASYPPKETLKRSGAGEYVIAVSPAPLFADGDDR